MWRRRRLVIYITLLEHSTKAEYYVVEDTGDDGSDLVTDGFCNASKLPSVLAESLKQLLSVRMDEPSR